MTVDDVKDRVAQLRAAVENRTGGDEENWHADEDALYMAVLHAIADGAPDPAALAREVLAADQIHFSRWYA